MLQLGLECFVEAVKMAKKRASKPLGGNSKRLEHVCQTLKVGGVY